MDIIYDYLWIFFIYAFAGWCIEVIYAAVNKGVFVNRGFLNGPICPIYGCGVAVAVLILTPVKDNVFILYICSVLLTSALELITGFIMEKLFKHRWWDYSHLPLNIGGYICLKFSLMWGVGCVLIIDAVHPVIMTLVGIIPKLIGTIVVIIFTVLILTDIALTVTKVIKLNKRLTQLEEIAAALKAISDKIGSEVATGAIKIADKGEKIQQEIKEKQAEFKEKQTELKEKYENLIQRQKESFSALAKEQKRFLRAFPGMKSLKHEKIFTKLKEQFQKKNKADK